MTPDTGLDSYYRRLRRTLKGIAFRLRLLIALESLFRLASLLLIILLGTLFVQGVMKVLPYFPFAYGLLALASLAAVFLLGLRRTVTRLPMELIARGLEEKFPGLKDDVTNSLSLFQRMNKPSRSDQISEGLVRAHLRKTAAGISDIRPGQVVSFRRVLPQVGLLLPLFLAFMVALALDPIFLNRSTAFILNPFSALPERETIISMEPAPAHLLRGSPVSFKAKTTGYVPEQLWLRLWPEKGESIRLDMESEGDGGFTHQIASAQASFRYQALSDRAHTPVHVVRVVDAPEIGGIELTLIPPAYTGLPRESRDEGHIEAIKGTVVNLEARATKEVREGKLILNQKDQILLKVEGARLTGEFPVLNSGSYSLSIRDDLGFENPDPVRYRIHLIPDRYPVGEITGATDDLEVSGSEVVPVIYSARDDFGVTAIRLIYETGGRERSISLEHSKDLRSAGPELFEWDLAGLQLTPRDRVTYRIGVWDNDSVSGPKAGYSRTFNLHVRDEKDRAARVAARAQSIADDLLDLLADHLEELKDRKAISDEIDTIMEKIDEHLERAGPDQNERYGLESLRRNLAALNGKIDELPRETLTREMERLALLAEDLVKKARMQEVEALAREIRIRQSQFIDALREHKGPLTPEDLKALSEELQKLKDLISRVMEAFTRMAAQLPSEFINSPELRGLDFHDMFKDLDEIQKRLMAGDRAGALEAAQKLLRNLTEMMAAMARAGARTRMNSFNRLQSEMTRQAGELEKILAEQIEMLSETDSFDRELKGMMEEQTGRRLDRMMPRFQEILDQLGSVLPPGEEDPAEEMKRLLKEGRMERLAQLAELLGKEVTGSPDVHELVDELGRMTGELTPDQSEIMTPDSRWSSIWLYHRQKRLQERTEDLTKRLEALSHLFPDMDMEILSDLEEGAASMGRAYRKLKAEDTSGAIPPEQEAIQILTRSQQAMDQMAQQMAQQMSMGMQANRWGYPYGYDPSSGWYYGPWDSLPTLPQPEVDQPLERGFTGIDKEEFDPPSRDSYKAPRILREKVMEALKEDIPYRYRREVERYFRRLTE
jgi:hypothetical protein